MLTTPLCKKLLCYETFTIASGLGFSFGTTQALEKEELPEWWKELIIVPIYKVIRQIVVIIEAYLFCQLLTKFYPTPCCQG
jgi:hypothetical protein